MDVLFADAEANLLVRATDLTESMAVSAQVVEDGIVVITAAGQAGSALYGYWTLFDLFLQVRNAGGCVDGLNLHLLDSLEYPEQGTVLYDAAGAPINLDLQDGALCFEPGDNCRLGDVNEDNVINLADFTHILHLTVEPELLTPCSQWAGDLYVDGLVNAQDANRLGRWLAGESMAPVKGMPWPVSVQSSAKAGSVTLVHMGEVFAAEDQTEVEVPLLIDAGSSALPLWGFEADLAYPVAIAGPNRDDGLAFSSLSLNGTPVVVNTATSSVNAIEDAETGYGLLRVAVAGVPDMGAKASAPVFTVTFHAGADLDRSQPIPVTLKRFVYHDAYGYAPQHGAPGTPVIAGQVPGDVNMDGVANYKDASWILQAAVGLRTLDGEANGDVTGDGVVNYKDASWILQAAVGLRTL